jgi:isocitrate dehydrogenase kinase/phosphatase
MFLRISDIGPGDFRHLFCTDPRLREEISQARRARHRSAIWRRPRQQVERIGRTKAPAPRPAA